MSMHDGEIEQAVEHEVEMALHRNNGDLAHRGPSPADQARLLDKVLDSELETTDIGLKNLRAKDFPLANYEEQVDKVEFKWLQEIINIFSKARYPHPRSGLQGLTRAWASGNPNDRREPLQLNEYAQDESYLQGTYSRATRGEEMAQQESTGKMITESKAIREDGKSDNGGLLGRLGR